MGNTQKQIRQPFHLDPIDDLSLQYQLADIQTYSIHPPMDPKIMENIRILKQNLNNINYRNFDELKRKLQTVDGTSCARIIVGTQHSDEDFDFLNNHRSVDEVVIMSENNPKVVELRKKFHKIKSRAAKISEILMQIINPSNYKNNMLFSIASDQSTANKLRMTQLCLLAYNDDFQAKLDFVKFLRQVFINPNPKTPAQKFQNTANKDRIQEFDDEFQHGITTQVRHKLVKKHIFTEGSLVWQAVEKLPKITTNPKRLGYIRGPFKDIHNTILREYRANQNDSVLKPVYIVAQLSAQQQTKLYQQKSKYLMFTSFIKGFTEKKDAREYAIALRKTKRTSQQKRLVYQFEVTFIALAFLDQTFDKGYMFSGQSKGQNIVFNIFNYFEVTHLENQQSQGTLLYGALPSLLKKRNDPFRRKDLKEHQREFLRQFDTFFGIMDKIANQGDVLKYTGNMKAALKYCQDKINFMKQTNYNQQQIDRQLIAQGNIYKQQHMFDEAVECYLHVQTEKFKLIRQLCVAEIIMYSPQHAEYFRKMILALMAELPKMRAYEFDEESFKVQHFYITQLIKDRDYRRGYQKCRKLIKEITQYYDYHENTLEFFFDILQQEKLCSDQLAYNNQQCKSDSTE